MTALTTTNPLAPNVAACYGASCKLVDGVYVIGNGVTQEDFDEALADLVARGAKPIKCGGKAAYDRLQSEGCGRDF